MTNTLLERGASLARAAQRRRLEEIAAGIRLQGVSVSVDSDLIICRGKRLVQRWLGDPMLRFIARSGS